MEAEDKRELDEKLDLDIRLRLYADISFGKIGFNNQFIPIRFTDFEQLAIIKVLKDKELTG